MANKVDYHQWLNTGLLAVLAFVANKYYEHIETNIMIINQHTVILNEHELRLTELEGKPKEKQTSMNVGRLEAILPECVEIKKEN